MRALHAPVPWQREKVLREDRAGRERGVQPARDPAVLLQAAVTAEDHIGAQSDFKNNILISESQIENVLL